MRTFQLKILEIPGAKLNGKKTAGKKSFRKFGYTSREISSYFLDQSEVKHQNQKRPDGMPISRAWLSTNLIPRVLPYPILSLRGDA